MSRKLISPFSNAEHSADSVARVVWNSSIISEYHDLYVKLNEQLAPEQSSDNADPGIVTDYTIEIMNAGRRKLDDIPANTFACRQDNDIFIQTAIGLFAGLTLLISDGGEVLEASYFAYADGLPVFKQKTHQAWSESLTLPAMPQDISLASVTENKQEVLYLKTLIDTPIFYEKTQASELKEYEVKKISMRLLLKCTIR
ncbi:MAG: hypothetical protein QM731_23220 [Chitinophagaceae bacterium]